MFTQKSEIQDIMRYKIILIFWNLFYSYRYDNFFLFRELKREQRIKEELADSNYLTSGSIKREYSPALSDDIKPPPPSGSQKVKREERSPEYSSERRSKSRRQDR